MNYRRSRVYAAPVPKMPSGLIELMEGLSKDVLRHNPSNIYEFCADHMQKLLQIRNETQRKKSTALQQRITKAQDIIRERAKQRREHYEKNYQAYLGDDKITNTDCTANSSDIQSSYSNIHNVAEDALVSESEMFPQNLPLDTSCLQEAIAKELIHYNNTTSSSGEHNNHQFENLTREEIKINDDINKCMLDVPGIEFTEGEQVGSSTGIQNTIASNVSNEEMCSADVNIPLDLTSQDNLKGPSSVNIDDIDSDAKKSKEYTGHGKLAQEGNLKYINISSENADELKIFDEQDATSSVEITQHQMDLETAAITIQKVFRTFLFKSKTTSLDDATNVDINLFIDENNLKNDINKERRAISRMDTVLQTVNEEKSLSLSTDDSSTLSSAATVIQAHIRGFLVRNKLNVNRTPTSAESMIDSKEFSCTSFETTNDPLKTKTVLNIHIVPEKDHFASRDESLLTSMDFSMDDSPHLMPLQASYDITERRKQLKREDAIQSVTPPSNASSSKLSEDIDSVREVVASDNIKELNKDSSSGDLIESLDQSNEEAHEIQTAVEKENNSPHKSLEKADLHDQDHCSSLSDLSKNPYECSTDSLKHSSEFHEVVLPTKVTRSDTSIVREFHNVLAYFLLWD